MSTLTAYQIIKRLNGKLAELGVEKVLPTQMGYTYAKKGMINNVKNCKTFTLEEADNWIEKYLVKNGYVVEAFADSSYIVADNDGTVGEW